MAERNDRDQQPDEDLPPIAEGIEDAIDSPPTETVSGDPAYAPDPEHAAMENADDEG